MLSRSLSLLGKRQQQNVRTLEKALSRRSYVSRSLPSLSSVTTPGRLNYTRRLPRRQGQTIPLHISDLQNSQSCTNLSTSSSAPIYHNQYESDLIVVLDMDECLLHSTFSDSTHSSYAYQVLERQQQEHQSAPSVETLKVPLEDALVTVNLRPGVQDFVDFCTSNFQTHIFTAALPVYANPVLDRLDPTDQLAGRWFRDSCQYYPDADIYSKRLENLPLRDLSRVILVDNNPLSFVDNPDNGILVKSFYQDASDETLPAVQTLLEELNHAPDVRPVLRRKFGLAQALEEYRRQLIKPSPPKGPPPTTPGWPVPNSPQQ